MRKLYILIAAAIVMGSCQNDTTEGFKGFESDKSEIKAKAAGGEHSITIRSDREWTAQADVPWLMISPANGRGEVECRVKVDSTLVNDPRTTTVRFMSDGEILQQIAITQDGFAHSIAASTDFVSIEASAVRAERYVEVDVKANVEFDVVSDVEWLSVGDYTLTLDRGARPRSTRLHIDWKMNSDPKSREAMLMLVPKNGETLEKPATIKVRQLAGPLIEDNRNGDSLAVVTIYNKMECWSEGVLSTTEPMDRWECLRLWKSSDKSLPCAEAIGRVRDLDLSYFNTEDDIPVEVKHLKYLETLSLYGNVNAMLKDINLCAEVATLNYLKELRVAAIGLVSLPDNFAELGDTLEGLYLDSNNFAAIPEVLSPENFPHLTALDLSSNRRYSLSDIRDYSSRDGIYANMDNDDAVSRLLLWENLEELGLSYNYIEGSLPDLKERVRAYTAKDIAERGDTLTWAVEHQLPRVLPNIRTLRLNLNFMTGELPEWLLYHPNLMEWAAEVLVFPQQEKSYDSDGNIVGFSNVPTSREYYFEAYPLYRSRYEFNDEME
ncbi:MAG: hypothetical protein IIW97_04825 [Alistipes sp.]|nr:hypothetical protein [Alistipes sp.]